MNERLKPFWFPLEPEPGDRPRRMALDSPDELTAVEVKRIADWATGRTSPKRMALDHKTRSVVDWVLNRK